MSYGDARANRTVAIGAVVAVHAALGYALLTGLATEAIHRVVSGPTIIYDVPPVEPPPPDKPLPKSEVAPAKAASEVVTAPVPEIVPSDAAGLAITSIEADPHPIVEATPGPVYDPPAPPLASLARSAAPRGNQGAWFPPDSYPAAAQRAGAEGLVSVRVTVGADGRVADCQVVASSGSADLDGATCRLAKRNGRFEPAHDANGQAVSSSYTLRNVRWSLVE